MEISQNQKEKQLLEVVKKEIWDQGRGYHTLEFPNGETLEGRFDMQKYLDYYKIPEDLHGKTVLDVGPANGYFSFEMEKRGADVTAIDLFPVFWRDELRELMRSKVNFVKQDISTLDESFGKFDIVFDRVTEGLTLYSFIYDGPINEKGSMQKEYTLSYFKPIGEDSQKQKAEISLIKKSNYYIKFFK